MKGISFIALGALLLTGSSTLAHGPGSANDFDGRRVLFIGIDGCRADALRRAVETGRAPHLRSLIDQGTVAWNAYTGGPRDAQPVQPTMSGPGWTTIFTGVWREKHGVADNRFRANRIAQWPHFLRRLRESVPTVWSASLCDWPEIHKFIVGESRVGGADFLNFEFTATPDPALKDRDFDRRDADLTARTVEHLAAANPDVLSIYFGQVDEVGHAVQDSAGRFSPENEPYLAAIARVDALIGEVLGALRARPKFTEEDWLVLATTDHGGRGTSHGGQSDEERTIWMVASGGRAPHGTVVTDAVPQTAIAATVFTHLGVPIHAEWGSEPRPFALPLPAPGR